MYVCCAQAEPVRANRNTAPLLLTPPTAGSPPMPPEAPSSFMALTASRLPSPAIATLPKLAPMLGFGAFRYACWDQVLPARVNTYTAPLPGRWLLDWSPLTPVAALASPGAPTASVLPSYDSESQVPKASDAWVFDALM